jgi:tRNA(Ile)-lysidine synthase
MSDRLDTSAIFGILDELKTRFGNRFIIGLSGGGDSMALAHLCATWAKDKDVSIQALCIDHAFRDASGEEARQAAEWARRLGIEAKIYTNTLPKPKSRLQEFARNLRLKAFGEAAHNAGGATILLGHTLDDQAETIAFRLARQTGLDGLAGMASVTQDLARWDSFSFPIARPLLSASRSDLRDYLRAIGQPWLEDPSNQNTDFARVKVRQRLATLGHTDRLIAVGRQAGLLRDLLDTMAREQEAKCQTDDGLNAKHFRDTSLVLQKRILARQLQVSATNHSWIPPEKLERLAAAMAQTDFSRTTLGGILVALKRGHFVFSTAPVRRNLQSKRTLHTD